MRKLMGAAAVAVATISLAAPALAAAPVRHAAVQDNSFLFSPHRLTVKRGTKVVWRWSGGFVAHNVTVLHGPTRFHSATKTTGTYSYVFKKRGRYTLYCTIHPNMREYIVVK